MKNQAKPTKMQNEITPTARQIAIGIIDSAEELDHDGETVAIYDPRLDEWYSADED